MIDITDEIKILYSDFMRDKIFKSDYYIRLENLSKKAASVNSELCRILYTAWNKTNARKKYCFDSQRIRFIAVMATISSMIK